jgi:hypothetical protein
MIRVECIIHTSIGKYTKETWPTEMAVRPLVGDLVKSESCDEVLKITNIMHTTLTVPDRMSHWGDSKEVLGLKVYLGL